MSSQETDRAPAKDYVYGADFAEERARLAGIERLWDSGTFALLAELGVTAGWQCLEVGAGGGSVVEWLAARVGASGRVLAMDIDTQFVEPLASEVVEVLRLDLRTDPLPEAAFDLVHARLLLEHLPDRRELLPKLVAALRPGGTLVVEDYDWTSFGFQTEVADLDHVAHAVLEFMADAGFSPRYGREVTSDLADAGLVDVRGEARARVIDSADPGFAFFRLSFESLKPAVVASGRLSAEEAEEASRALAAPGVRVITPQMIAGIGRRSAD
jgi:SAM-dependent methyltransferase